MASHVDEPAGTSERTLIRVVSSGAVSRPVADPIDRGATDRQAERFPIDGASPVDAVYLPGRR